MFYYVYRNTSKFNALHLQRFCTHTGHGTVLAVFSGFTKTELVEYYNLYHRHMVRRDDIFTRDDD
jgi:hypothetical protein